MSLKRRHSQSDEQASGASQGSVSDLFKSEPIEDRTSTFVAFFSPTLSPKDLQNHEEAKSASHRMLAWRRRSSSQRTIVSGQRSLETGYDDDGEKFGGKKVLSALESTKVEGSLMVARWYGGIMLGPVRFTHIDNCAREAVRAWQQHQQAQILEQSRLKEEAREKNRLVEELKQRDDSITTLRSLLEAKTKRDKSNEENSRPSSQPTPAVDYAALPLQRLRLLDKARDSTISFLLRQIDAAEKKSATPTHDVKSQANGNTVPTTSTTEITNPP